MCFRNISTIQILFASLIRTLAFAAIALMIFIRGASAQCPPNPDPATSHPNGVIEGPVSCIGDQSVRSTVGIRDEAEA